MTMSGLVMHVDMDAFFASGLQRLIGSPEEIGRRTKTIIRAAVGLSASVGIGPNRLIAKLASDYRKPNGLTVVPADAVMDFLGPMPVGSLRGAGPKTRTLVYRR